MELEIRSYIEDVIKKSGFILDEVTYEKDGKMGTLTVVIDKKGIVTIDDCVLVTNLINPILDSKDPIKESYVLDVCSKEKGCE